MTLLETTTKIPAPTKAIAVGDIFVSTWGYDQTNKTFYQVVALAGKASAKLARIASDCAYDGQKMTGVAMPIKDAFKADDVKLRRIKQDSYGDVCFKITSYEFARRWNGQPQNYTSYA
jgi:hypothetical protein